MDCQCPENKEVRIRIRPPPSRMVQLLEILKSFNRSMEHQCEAKKEDMSEDEKVHAVEVEVKEDEETLDEKTSKKKMISSHHMEI